jgi:beta-glucanase (GH16 family)
MPSKSFGVIKAQAAGNPPVGQSGTNWVETFGDDFNGTALNRSIWRSDIPNGGNGEMQEYVNDDSMGNYQVQNGILTIIARKESYSGRNYTSGVILTQGRFSQKYGYFEMRAKVPHGKGLWPAFWMLADPWVPEIDITEILAGQPNVTYMTLHYSGGQSMSQYTGPDFSADWHTFGVDWEPSALVWYVDGVEQKRITNTSIIPSVPMWILANLAVGGNWPGNPDSTTVFPASFSIDYIRAWQKSSSPVATAAPTKAPTTAPTAAPTKAPTSAPTSGPTAVPTKAPTSAPTTAPTAAPTSGPASAPVTTGNLIKNDSFEDTSASPWNSPWSYRNDLAATLTQDTTTAANSTRASIKISLPNSNASQPWVVSVTQSNKALTAGQSYSLSFWAKASANRPIRAIVQEQNSPYPEYTKQTANLTTSWARYSYSFTASTNTSAAMLNFNLADASGNVWIDDVAMCQAGSNCGSSGSSAPAPTAAPTQGVVNPTPTAPFQGAQDTTAPSVKFTNPLNNSKVKIGSHITITATASDSSGISRLVFRINGALACTQNAAPYTCDWTVPSSVGTTYKIAVRAYDIYQNVSHTSVTVTSIR